MAEKLVLGAAATEDTPTSVTSFPWLYESRPENAARNVYPQAESGKWMMFYAGDGINAAWSRAKELYRSGQLPDISSMKVSTAMPNPAYPWSTESVLIFYCGPASDENKMVRIGRDLAKKMRYHKRFLCYKTDMQTMEGIRGSTYKINLH